MTVTYPTGIAAGDRLIVMVTFDGAPTTSGWPTGWNQRASVADATSACRVQVYEKIAAGTETGTFNVTVSASEAFVGECLRITGGHASSAVEVATATGSTTNPDPPNLDPSGWATEDTLWIAYSGGDGGATTYTAAPTSYGTLVARTVSNAANGVCSGYGSRQNAVSAENPGVFTRATEQWVAVTIAVRTTAAVVTGAASLTGVGSVAAAGVAAAVVNGAASLTATGSVDAAGVAETPLPADLMGFDHFRRGEPTAGLKGPTDSVFDLNAFRRNQPALVLAEEAAAGGGVVTGAAALNATGTIATAGQETLLRTGALNAAGAIASAAIFWSTLERAAAANATGAIQTAGAVIGGAEEIERSAAVNAAAAVATSGRSVISRSAAVNATASVVSVGQEGPARAAALTASGAVTTAGVKIVPRQAAVNAAASIGSAGEVTGPPEIITGQADLTAAATLAAAGTVTSPQTVTASAHLDAVATIEVTVAGGSPPPALVGAGRIPQQQRKVVEAAAHLNATARIDTTHRWTPRPLSPVVFARAAGPTATATLDVTARPIRIRTGAATLAGTSTIGVRRVRRIRYLTATSSFRLRSSVLATGTTVRHGQAKLDGSAHMRTGWDTPLTERQRDEELLLLLIGGDDL